jgi:hypothetical protein
MKAFPQPSLTVTDMGQVRAFTVAYDGMDLRDYFAAKAIHIVYQICNEFEDGFSESDVANMCYSVADAMMEARVK